MTDNERNSLTGCEAEAYQSDLLPCKKCGRMPIKFVMRFDCKEQVSYGCVCAITPPPELDAVAKWNEKQGRPSDNTVIKELAEALGLVHDHLEPSCEDFEGNATGPLIEVEGALTKHAERIKQCT